jgi:hypothetical protein
LLYIDVLFINGDTFFVLWWCYFYKWWYFLMYGYMIFHHDDVKLFIDDLCIDRNNLISVTLFSQFMKKMEAILPSVRLGYLKENYQ